MIRLLLLALFYLETVARPTNRTVVIPVGDTKVVISIGGAVIVRGQTSRRPLWPTPRPWPTARPGGYPGPWWPTRRPGHYTTKRVTVRLTRPQTTPSPTTSTTRATAAPTPPALWRTNENICPPSLCVDKKPFGDTKGTQFEFTPFFEGDIVLTDAQRKRVMRKRPSFLKELATREIRRRRHVDSRTRSKRAAVRDAIKLWPGGIVPYQVDKSLNRYTREAIAEAHRRIERHTCIRFRPKSKSHKDFLHYVNEPGCWSLVGRIQGEQRVGAGSLGCEYTGIMLHETGHALGFWHEQSRLDRDKYVRLNLDEMSERGRMNSVHLNSSAATSLGYPYDYNSVMHYGDRAFTRAGRKTIELIGVGKERGLKIGQRDGLSDIDIAQLRDMYRCNRKLRVKEKPKLNPCPEGWLYIRSATSSSCYGLFRAPKQYAPAIRICERHKAHLLHLESKEETKAVMLNLRYYSRLSWHGHAAARTWRLGARRFNGSLWWHSGAGRVLNKISGANWKQGHPARYTTVGLEFNSDDPEAKWVGLWAGSQKHYPRDAYPFVCEIDLKPDTCYKRSSQDRIARLYRGTRDYTESGVSCQKWSSIYPHIPTFKGKKKSTWLAEGLGDHASCRNPWGLRERPWCYTTKSSPSWEYCDIPFCD